MKVITASSGTDCKGDCNGLSEPPPVDVDGNFTVDYVYAGDLRGNLWKFDLTSTDHDKWGVYHKDGINPAPLFTARGPGNLYQPITTTPSIMRHPLSDKPGFLVVFGTGKYLHTEDMQLPRTRDYSDVETIYGVWDYGDASGSSDPDDDLKDRKEYLGLMTRAGSGASETNTLSNPKVKEKSSLQRQGEIFYEEVHFYSCPFEEEGGEPFTVSISQSELKAREDEIAGCSKSFSRFLRVLSNEPINWVTQEDDEKNSKNQADDPSTKEPNHVGWYFDLPHTSKQERVVRSGLIRDGKYVVITSIPRRSPCSAGGESILHEMNAATGGRLPSPAFDIDLDAAIAAGDLIEIEVTRTNPDTGEEFTERIRVAPTGIHFRKMMYPPVILQMPDQKTEMKYFSTASGNITMVQEVAEQRGMFYWRQWF